MSIFLCKVYSANVELNIDKEIENVKNIIEVKDGTSISVGLPIFVDIDGNLYTKE